CFKRLIYVDQPPVRLRGPSKFAISAKIKQSTYFVSCFPAVATCNLTVPVSRADRIDQHRLHRRHEAGYGRRRQSHRKPGNADGLFTPLGGCPFYNLPTTS